jgi:hypothetical protein
VGEAVVDMEEEEVVMVAEDLIMDVVVEVEVSISAYIYIYISYN